MKNLFNSDYIGEESISYEKRFLEYCQKKKNKSKYFSIIGLIVSIFYVIIVLSTDPLVLGILAIFTLFGFLVFLVSLFMFINFGVVFIISSLGLSGVKKSKLKYVIMSKKISVLYLIVFAFCSLMTVIWTFLNGKSMGSITLLIFNLIIIFSCSQLFMVKYIKLSNEYIKNKEDELLKIEERNSFCEMFK